MPHKEFHLSKYQSASSSKNKAHIGTITQRVAGEDASLKIKNLIIPLHCEDDTAYLCSKSLMKMSKINTKKQNPNKTILLSPNQEHDSKRCNKQ